MNKSIKDNWRARFWEQKEKEYQIKYKRHWEIKKAEGSCGNNIARNVRLSSISKGKMATCEKNHRFYQCLQ